MILTNNDGSITRDELSEGVIRFSPQEVEAIMALGDVNDDGSLDMEEFIGVLYPSAATIASRMRAQYTDINSIKKAFPRIDTIAVESLQIHAVELNCFLKSKVRI